MASQNSSNQNFRVSANPLHLTTLDGFPGGMNVNDSPQEIDDTQARYIQDGLLNERGLVPRRGPVQSVSNMVSFGTNQIVGIAQAISPDSVTRFGAVYTDTSGNIKFDVLSSTFSAKTTVGTANIVTTSGSNTLPPIVDIKPSVDGGAWIGVSQQTAGSTGYQRLVKWNGGNLADYTTGTITASSGSSTVTGSGTSWTNTVCPGMYLMNSSGFLIGMIKTVDSGTQVTLSEPVLATASAGAYTATSLRAFRRVYSIGNITCDTGHTSVVGGGTAFLTEGIGAWAVYRAKDNGFVGTISTVNSDSSITLTGNAAFTLSEEEFFMVPGESVLVGGTNSNLQNTATVKPGFLTAAYAGRQFYANRGIPADAGGEWVNRLWYSEVTGAEDMSLATVAGNFIPIASGSGGNTPIKAIVPAYNSLVVLKELESFVLTGTDPDSFVVRKINDDGTLCSMSAMSYDGGALWAGRNGIYLFDGVNVTNLTQNNLGLYYTNALRGFDPSTYRIWATVVRDHYIVHIQNATPSVPVVKGSTSVTPSYLTIVIYLPNNAISMFTNVRMMGSAVFSTSSGQNGWYAIYTATGSSICDFSSIFDTQGTDTLTCSGATAGPDLYIESKRYSAGNGLLLKAWKELLLNYLVGGDTLSLDTIKGLNTAGTKAGTTFPQTVYTWNTVATAFPLWVNLGAAFPTWSAVTGANLLAKRIKFIKRDRYFGFRIYQTSSSVTSAVIGAFALAYKIMRVGRV